MSSAMSPYALLTNTIPVAAPEFNWYIQNEKTMILTSSLFKKKTFIKQEPKIKSDADLHILKK